MPWPLIRLLPREFHIDFVRLAPFAAVISAIAIAASGYSFATQGMNLGIDFRGGTVVELSTAPAAADIGKVRQALGGMGLGQVGVQGLANPSSVEVRFRAPAAADASATVAAVEAKLTQALGTVKFNRADVVGPRVSGELMSSGFMALGIALALMLGYIWFRFQLQFGLGAVAAVFHDVLLTLGMLSITHIEFSMTSIAALLTVIGYSMNEKVITFDRLRENLRRYKTAPLRDVINRSENERLSRTVITGSTAILALAGALFMGGPVLFPLVVTMVFGIFIGTYSSIYVALPIILLWGVKRGVDDEPAEPLKTARAR